MRLLGQLTSSLVLTALAPGTLAAPPATQPDAGLSSPTAFSIERRVPPSLSKPDACGWKLWGACLALALGVCFETCMAGGLADPACDACCVGMGGLGCGACLHDDKEKEYVKELQTSIRTHVANDKKLVEYWRKDLVYMQATADAGPGGLNDGNRTGNTNAAASTSGSHDGSTGVYSLSLGNSPASS